MINAGDSTAVVKEQIEDAVALAGYSAPTSWADATDKINDTADQFERDQIADGMNGGLARDRINALFGGPVWAPEGARLTIDFAANKAWTRNSAVTDSVDAVDLTRAGSVLMLGPNGYESFASGELARIDGVGAQVAPARANKCTNYNAAPTGLTGLTQSGDAAATLTVVDDEAALRAAGFGRLIDEGKMNGKVFKLDNSLGLSSASLIIAGTIGAAAPRTLSLVARREGTTVVNFGASGTVVRGLVPVGTSAYARFSIYDASATGGFTIAAQAGNVVYFILNQLEEGSYASPPIITSGAAVSRPGDILSASVPDGGRAFVFEFDIKGRDANGRYLAQWIDGSSGNRYTLCINTAGTAFSLDVGSGGSFVGGVVFSSNGPVIGRHFISGVARGGYVYAADLGAAEPSPSNLIAPLNINRLGLGGNGINTANNSFSVIEKFCEADVLDFASSDEARAWAKSIAQGWAYAGGLL